MKYEQPIEASWSDVHAAVLQQDPDTLMRALVGAVHREARWERSQDECLRLIGHSNVAVRRLAVTCLGHVARIHRHIDRAKVLERLAALEADPEMAGAVQNAYDDIETFTR